MIFTRSLIIIAISLTYCSKCYTQPLVCVEHDAFTSYYDLQAKCPALVVWPLRYRDFQGNLKPTSRRFKTDTQLPPPRVKDKDLAKTGYVRGHLCPVADRDSDKGMLKQTYLTSNMTPMTMVCNSGAWKMVEDTIRHIVKTHGSVISAAGCIFPDSILGQHKVNGISVPVAFYRIARCRNHPDEIWIWIVNNSSASSKCVRVSTRTLEDVLHQRGSITHLLKNHQLIP